MALRAERPRRPLILQESESRQQLRSRIWQKTLRQVHHQTGFILHDSKQVSFRRNQEQRQHGDFLWKVLRLAKVSAPFLFDQL